MYKDLVINLIKDSIISARITTDCTLGTKENPLILGNVAFWMDEDKVKCDTHISSWDIPAWTNDVMYWIRSDK